MSNLPPESGHTPGVCGIDIAVQADTLGQIGNTAVRLEQWPRWKWAQEQFVNNEAANRQLIRSTQGPWRL